MKNDRKNRKASSGKPLSSMIKRAENFTMIELITVITIILILVSILLPALKNSIKKAQGITCTSNLKTLTMTMFSYQADWGGKYPNRALGNGNGNPSWTTSWLQDFKVRIPSQNGISEIFRCPLHPKYEKTSACWYKYNTTYNWYNGISARMKSPSSVIAFIDGEGDTTNGLLVNFDNSTSNRYAGNFHSPTAANTGYMDGHVGLEYRCTFVNENRISITGGYRD